jgi:hypothetical protein
MRQEKGFKFCLDSKNNGALPLDLAKPEHLSAHPSVYPRQSGKKRGLGPVSKNAKTIKKRMETNETKKGKYNKIILKEKNSKNEETK